MTDTMNSRSGGNLSERSTAELVKLASEQISQLVRDELKLATTEMKEKGKHAGVGAGLFGGGGVLALYGLAGLFTTIVFLLDLVMPLWAASGLVTLVLFVGAGVLALLGRKQVKQATPAMPERAVSSVKQDIHTVTDAVKERGQR
jgi:uncharacterized membrane protein YqjE